MRQLIPWWGRIAAKLALSRLPASYGIWRGLNVFRHGAMHRTDYALRSFEQHFAHSKFEGQGVFRVLELGPGDSLLSALIARARGCTQTYLIDAGAFAATDMELYRQAAHDLHARGLAAVNLDGVPDVARMLEACNASYGAYGLTSLREIPTASIDFIWSQAVLEHVRRAEFAEFICETRRVLRPQGRCSHEIDLRDHLGGALNNMRIGSRWWETDWMSRSGFYTNRLRQSEIMRVFAEAGFRASIVDETRWHEIPTAKEKLAVEFRHLPAAELQVKTFQVLLDPV